MKRPMSIAGRKHAAAITAPAPPKSALEQPAYAEGFAEWLAYVFAQRASTAVQATLDYYFPDADLIDCAYVLEVLHSIEQTRYCERGVGCGSEFVFWGTQYAAPSMAQARAWVAARQAQLGRGQP
ncbi:hypothetical protein [Hymenobacter latericus]|uniref:hypothetical protein n=1 Tax=Hymenobacter sp. YIM 151858-1 TaxID=2987688 RepID=UPI0022264C03|nr:hypothetical protein [Hymenobacter sp. YIM 151858-1]UYZ60545.1 hypothetical protein OIS50_07025 [Hymenobacter sp. YIM 151858-1]